MYFYAHLSQEKYFESFNYFIFERVATALNF